MPLRSVADPDRCPVTRGAHLYQVRSDHCVACGYGERSEWRAAAQGVAAVLLVVAVIALLLLAGRT